MSELDVQNLQTYFYTRGGVVKAVDGMSFKVEKGKTIGIVGESGSGKSVTMMSVLGLIPKPPGKIVGGRALFNGKDLLTLSPRELRAVRGKQIAMIFQDPMTSLNPYLKIATQLTEVLTEHDRTMTNKEARRRAIESLELVGISDPESRIDHYPHQFSGGMRQRVMIAMAIITRPDILIADEPTTALDVTIQAQILTLLKKMQEELGLAIVLITHDLGIVAGMADHVCVMYAGRMVEEGTVDEIFYENAHPYTYGLLRSNPQFDDGKKELFTIAGLPPDPSRLPPGCAFAPRCFKVFKPCRNDVPLPQQKLSGTHQSVCYLEERTWTN